MTSITTRVNFTNGLTVHLKEIHTAPLISFWVWYRVGSRNEVPGKTGLSHWVEHMQFKGTSRFPGTLLDKSISREGGSWNAMTHLDWTTYYEKMPAGRIDLALQLEADRMLNSIFDPQEVESERTVIISELEGNENEPLFRLDDAMQHAAFDQHPYRHEVIGEKVDLWQIQRDDLYRHYRTYYTPNNAVVAVAGDFSTEEMLARLGELYGGIPAGEPVEHRIPLEPPLQAERRVELTGPGETTYLRQIYRAPEGRNPDFFAFSVLDSLLSGPSGLFLSGGGLSNKTSRLYQALVDEGLAISISGGLPATIDPFLYSITAIVHPDHSAQEVQQAIDDQIHRLQDEPAPPEELTRAIKQARALFAYGTENITNQAFWLGCAEMFADYAWFEQYMERIAQVTPEDVMRIARTYLVEERRVSGVYLPQGGSEEGEE
jgi:zinc protease